MNFYICKKCSKIWHVEQIDNELWRIVSFEKELYQTPKPLDVEQLENLVMFGTYQMKWEYTIDHPSFIIAGVTACCAVCSGELEQTYLLNLS